MLGGMTIVVISGAQATGKTTLAMALGSALGAPVFSRDPLMAVLFGGGLRERRLGRITPVPVLAIRLQTALLASQLKLGQSAVLECIVPPDTREQWRAMAEGAGSAFLSVECVCSDPAEHRARFDRRQAPGRHGGLSWRTVQATMRRYQPDPHPDTVADSMDPPEDILVQLLELIRRCGGPV